MLLGHQGASARTDCMYREMASRVASSSQDSGSLTIRVGTCMSSMAGSVGFGLRQSRQQPIQRKDAAVEVHLQRTDAGGEIDDAGEISAVSSQDMSAWTCKRNSRSSTMGPYSTNTLQSPARR